MLLDSVNSLKRSGVHNLRESMSSQAGFRVNSSLLKASRSLGNEEFLLCDSSEGLLCQNNDLKKVNRVSHRPNIESKTLTVVCVLDAPLPSYSKDT